MPKSHSLGLHTRDEQDRALEAARKIFREALMEVRTHQSRDAFMFGAGFLEGVATLANQEGVVGVVREVQGMIDDLHREYHRI